MSERKVLAVPSQNTPSFDTNMPMDMNVPLEGDFVDQQPMDSTMPMDNTNQQENYGADFDAGVEANEQEDPKKFIQQLTGKLSQSLRKYNESMPQPDAELSKYVAGMVVKQAIEGLSQEDVSDILDKVQNDTTEEETMEQPSQNMPDANQQQMDVSQQPDMTQEQQPLAERTISTNEQQPNNNKVKAPTKMKKDGYIRKPYRTTV